MRASSFRGAPSRAVPVTTGFGQRRATKAQDVGWLSPRGPVIVFLVLLIWRIRKHREESHRKDSPS